MKFSFFRLVGLIIFSSAFGLTLARADSLPSYSFSVPSSLASSTLTYFSPLGTGSTVDSNGNYYLVDSARSLVYKFNAAGNLLLVFGAKGSGTGQLSNPQGVAIDSSGNFYILDKGNNRVVKFDSSGAYQLSFGSFGSNSDQLKNPSAIFIQGTHLFIADTDNGRIQRFTLAGVNDQSINTTYSPTSFVVNSSGNLYVLYSNSNLVQKFNSSGTLLGNLQKSGSNYLVESGLSLLAIDGNDRLYVYNGDSGGQQLTQFSSADVWQSDKSLHTLSPYFHSARALAVNLSNSRLYLTGGDPDNFVTEFNPSTWQALLTIGASGTGNGEFNKDTRVAVDKDRNFLILDHYDNGQGHNVYRLQKFDHNGQYLSTLRTDLDSNYTSVALDSGGNIYLGTDCEVKKYNPTGQSLLLTFLPPDDCGDLGPFSFSAVAFDQAGNVYANGTDAGMLYKFDSGGNYLDTFTGGGGIAIDSSDHLYISGASSIEKLSTSGQHLAYIGSGLSHPNGVAVDSAGNVYVSDYGTNLVKKFDQNGNLLYTINGDGTRAGEFYIPRDINIDSAGFLSVSDDLSRVLVFEPSLVSVPHPILSKGALSITEGESDTFNLSLSDQPSGNVTISMSVSDPTTGSSVSVAPTSTIFTTSNWNLVQPITVTALDDGSYSGNRSAQINFTISSSDSNYNAYNLSPLNIGIIEDESTPVSNNNGCLALASTDLCEKMTYEFETRLAGLTPNDATKNVWSARGNGSGGWTRNTSFWGSTGTTTLNFTGVSPWNSFDGYNRAGTLITPRHLINADHYPIPNGSTIIFVTSDNQVVSRTITAQKAIANSDGRLLLLNQDVPAGITYYPILSYQQVKDYFSNLRVPLLMFNQFDRPITGDLTKLTYGSFSELINDSTVIHNSTPASSNRHAFQGEPISGDSGDALFFLINGQPVLASTHTSAATGPFYSRGTDFINQAIVDLGNDGGYRVTNPDLSSFAPDSVPVVASSSFTVAPGAAENTTVGTVSATDSYGGTSTLTYSIESGNTASAFAINGTTGVIRVNNSSALDLQTNPTFDLVIGASDAWPYSHLGTSTSHITLVTPIVTHTITATAGDHGSLTPSGEISVTDGHNQEFIIKPDSGYKIASLLIDGQSVVPVSTYTFESVTADHTLSVEFESGLEAGGQISGGGGGGGGGGGKNQTPTNPTDQLAKLKEELSALQTRLALLLQNQTAHPNNPFLSPLQLNQIHPDVLRLQQYLNAHSFLVAVSGAGSPGHETNLFGEHTYEALGRFQLQHGLVKDRTDPAYGYFGPKTRALINSTI